MNKKRTYPSFYAPILLQVWVLILCVMPTQLQAQKYPQNYFRYPLDSLPNLVSPYGVLRDNHFHSGQDLRTNGREGLPVYAAADGYVSRIKVQRNGYGKAIYIEHANGFATVYGHLQKYNGAIADWVHNYQYINQNFEFDKIYLSPFLKVKKGDTIGWSGNSGGSTGPHLHYEIRDSKTGKTLNPALFGLVPIDSLKPTIFKIQVYKFVTEGLLLKSKILVQTKTTYLQDSMLVLKDTLVLDPDIYGFAIEAYDYIHNAKDEKGIYEYSFWNNGKQKFRHVLNQFAFDESKYINAHIDYPYYKIEKNRVQKCFVDDGNLFSSYTYDKDLGRLNLINNQASSTGELLFVVKDFNQNTFYLKVPYKIGPSKEDQDRIAYQKSILGKFRILPGKAQILGVPDFEVKMNPKSIYDTVYSEINTIFGQVGTYSKEYIFHTPNVPIHTAFDVGIRVAYYPKGFQDKLLLAYRPNKSASLRSAGGYFANGWVRGKGGNFGNYCVVMDTFPPKIKRLISRNPERSIDTSSWNFEVTDDFSGIEKYNAYLNGRWILLDFDAKNDLLSYQFDEVYFSERDRIFNLENDPDNSKVFNLLVRVEDAKGNIQEKYYNMVPK